MFLISYSKAFFFLKINFKYMLMHKNQISIDLQLCKTVVPTSAWCVLLILNDVAAREPNLYKNNKYPSYCCVTVA